MSAELAGATVSLPTSERARALIAWLALHPGPQPRAVVAEQLWPEAALDSARANLRTAVWAARQALADRADLTASRTTLSLTGVTRDIDEPPTAEHGPAELLPDLHDDWVQHARDELADRWSRDLRGAALAAQADGDLDAAVAFARRRTTLRPLDEAAHRLLLELLLDRGDRADAVQAANDFAQRLSEALGVRPSPATRAVHARFRDGRAPEPRVPLFGRAAQVGWLVDRWREASRGAGLIVVLTGEAGIGKTTLLNELVRRADGLGGLAARASGIDVAGETPFAVGLELARGLAGGVPAVPAQATWAAELNRLSPELGARLGHPQTPPAVTAPELERLRVFESLLRLFEWSCRDRPTLLAVDDADRADRASLRLVAHLGRRLSALPALVVLTRRDPSRRPDLDELVADLAARGIRVETLTVPPIDDAAVAALARSVRVAESARVDEVVAAADGNPLLAVEASRAILAGGSGPAPTLRSTVAATLGRLQPSAAALARLLAAAGRPLWPAELRRLGLAPESETMSSTEGLLIRREGRVGFRHDLLRVAVYAGLADPQGLHDRLADAIDPAEHVERAYHLAAAGRVAESAAQLAAAADRARAVGALDEAAELLERAVGARPDDGELWLELEEVYAWAHRRQDQESAWTTAVERLPAEALPDAWCRRGRQFRSVSCNPEEALRAYRMAAALERPDTDVVVRAETLLGLAWCDSVPGTGERYEALIAEAEALGALSAQLRADALEIRMQGLIRRARFAEAALLVADPDDPLVAGMAAFPDRAYGVFVNAACALAFDGRDTDALVMVERAIEATRAVGGLLMKIRAARAQLLARLGRHDEAAAEAADVLGQADRLDDPSLTAIALHDQGLIAFAAGRYLEAEQLLGQGLAGGAAVSRVTAQLTRAEALALAGRAPDAVRQLRVAVLEPVRWADQAWTLVPRVAWVQALIAHGQGDAALTRRRLDESRSAWRRLAGSTAAETADGYLASLIDLGRPPIVGLIEPAKELARIDALAHVVDSEHR